MGVDERVACSFRDESERDARDAPSQLYTLGKEDASPHGNSSHGTILRYHEPETRAILLALWRSRKRVTRLDRKTDALKHANLAMLALGLASDGLTDESIAAELHVSLRTAKRLLAEARGLLAEVEEPKPTVADYMATVMGERIIPQETTDPETGRVTIDLAPYIAREAREKAFDPEGYAYRREKVLAEAQLRVLKRRDTGTRARGPKKASQEKREAAARDRRHRKLLTSR